MGWATAAKHDGLPFGVSVYATHTWSWMKTAQRADKTSPFSGIFYDCKMTSADGKGKWRNLFTLRELYAQNHPLSKNSADDGIIHKQWNWGNGTTPPSKAYREKFYNRQQMHLLQNVPSQNAFALRLKVSFLSYSFKTKGLNQLKI